MGGRILSEWLASRAVTLETRERRTIQNFQRHRESALGGRYLPQPGREAGRGQARQVQRRRSLFPDFGECARRGCLRRAAVLEPRRFSSDGIADDDGRVQARVGLAHHRGRAVLLLRAPGPQGQAARSDFREAGRRLDGDRRREPRADARFARAADSGLFQRAGGPLVRYAGAGGVLPAEENAGI